MSKKSLVVLSRIDHDGKAYEAGASLELDDEAAAPLIACGAAELVEASLSRKARKKAEADAGAAEAEAAAQSAAGGADQPQA